MLVIDYDDYFIARHCPVFEPGRKYVFWGMSNV